MVARIHSQGRDRSPRQLQPIVRPLLRLTIESLLANDCAHFTYHRVLQIADQIQHLRIAATLLCR
jgi:hypothetical protein